MAADQGARIKIADGRLPVPALPPAATGLALGADPQTFGRTLAREGCDIVIGRMRLCDGADQNKALAALSVIGSSNGMAR